MTWRRGQLIAAVALGSILAGCGEYSTVKPVAAHAASTVTLPPVGFDHQYGNDPLASRDGLSLERQFFAQRQFWEVYLGVMPVGAGYFKLGTPTVLTAARHDVTSVVLVLATEQEALISGLLAYSTDAGQQAWAEGWVSMLRHLGYTGLTGAHVYIYFTEAHLHSELIWSSTSARYVVHDGDLKGTGLPFPGQKPLAVPTLAPAD